jgi:Amt family ammonium transporter
MAAGFAMLESGLVTSKSVSCIAVKNIGLYSIAGLMFWLVGYNLAYGIPEGGFIGTILPWSDRSSLETGYSDGSDWFFQMVFCATTASIVSGALAERILIYPFFAFVVVLTAILYPISGSWQWGGGWLSEMGFSDFAGSTIVHSVGGWAALTGAIILGARTEKYGKDGEVNVMPGSSIPMATLGVWILWLGWFGFNVASQLALGTYADANAVATIFTNTPPEAAIVVLVKIVATALASA